MRPVLVTFVFLMTMFTVMNARTACYDPAIESGYAYKDQTNESLVVVQQALRPKGAKFGDTIAGIGVKGLYFGCKVPEAAIAPRFGKSKKFSLFLPIRGATVHGFELDLSTETRRILSARPIQVPWNVVDHNQGVMAACGPSTPNAFEGFLYGALRNAKSRRCTEVEIEGIVGRTRSPVKTAPMIPAMIAPSKAPTKK